MSESNMVVFEGVERKTIESFTEKAYLDYSMYVIMDRALPHIADGLKPVQRRIVYAMSELGLHALAKYKKSARTVGDVLGKFHPHGDSACYEAMVLLAQPFSYRYPLIDGQGNWGSPDDPKSFAAMRYTEARLSKFSQVLLSELDQGTVEWASNFDGTLEEPKILPARLPALLLNGVTGIAVGMATDILPHNLQEVAEACIFLLKKPTATLKEIMQILPGPDFPTTAEIITPKEELVKMYMTGQGSVKMRAEVVMEEDEIVVTALPYQVSGAKVIEQIAAQMQAKKLPMVVDLRDESCHENPTRLVIVPRSGRMDKEALLLHLFATTDLERSYRVNMNVIGLNGKPQTKGLIALLQEWLIFRVDTVRRRLHHRLDKVLARLDILKGLLIAFLNIDEVIHVIRHEDEPKMILMKRWDLTEIQAEAILELKLRHLAKLEEQKIRGEQKKLAEERDKLMQTLDSEARLKTLVRKEIEQDKDTFGDARRSPLIERQQAQAIKETDRVGSEPVTMVLSTMGWIRAAKGHETKGEELNYKAGDSFFMQVLGKSNEPVYFLDSRGRSYSLLAHTLPSARGQGEPLTATLKPESGAAFIGMVVGDPTERVALLSSQGYGFITTIEDLSSKNRSGKVLLKLAESSTALMPIKIPSSVKGVAIVTTEARLLIVSVKDFAMMSKGKGNKIIALDREAEKVVAMAPLSAQDNLIVVGARRSITLSPKEWEKYWGEKGKRGHVFKGLSQPVALLSAGKIRAS